MKKVLVVLVTVVVTVIFVVAMVKFGVFSQHSKIQQIDVDDAELYMAQNDNTQQIDAELCEIGNDELQAVVKVLEVTRQRNQGNSRDIVASLMEEMRSTHARNQVYVSNLLDSIGWLDNLSDCANRAIFYVIQHAPPSFQEKYIHLLKEAQVPFIDFTVIDLNEKPVRLSDRIVGKPAVLHLWTASCAPCRKKGKELIPVYEEFRDKGFVVFGVAHERNISTAEAAIRLDKYPWENFVELDNVEEIRLKYGFAGGAGSHFLIDEKGNIIAVAPSIDEIRDFLLKF